MRLLLLREKNSVTNRFLTLIINIALLLRGAVSYGEGDQTDEELTFVSASEVFKRADFETALEKFRTNE